MRISIRELMYIPAVFATAFGWLNLYGIVPALVVLAFWLWVRMGKEFGIFTIIWCLFAGLLLTPASTSPGSMPKRVQCRHQLRQLGFALLNYEAVNGRLPPAFITDGNGKPMHSWRVLILPYIEQSELYRQYRFDEPWDGPNNSKLAEVNVDVFRCPCRNCKPGHASYSIVASPNGAMRPDYGCELKDVTDGMDKTGLIVESSRDVPWTKPETLAVDELFEALRPNGSQSEERHTNSPRRNFSVAYIDGRVGRIGGGGTCEAYDALFSIDGNEPESALTFPFVDESKRGAGISPKYGVAVSAVGFCLLSLYPICEGTYRRGLRQVGLLPPR